MSVITPYDRMQDQRIKAIEDRIGITPPPPEPGCGANPDPANTHTKNHQPPTIGGGWGGSTDSYTWEATTMRDDPSSWKIVDQQGKNIAHKFATELAAKQYIAYYQCVQKTEPCTPEQCEAGYHWDASICQCVADPTEPPGQDGDVQLRVRPKGQGVEYEFSSSNKDRYQLKAKLPAKWINTLQVGAFKILEVNTLDEEISGKNRGNGHSDSTKDEASCFIQGLRYRGTVNSQYEQPHPRNHPLPYQTVTELPYGTDIVGKWVVLQNIIRYSPTTKTNHLETWVDLKASEIDTKGKPGNDYVLFYKAETAIFGDKHNADNEEAQSYWRLDEIPDGHVGANVMAKYCKVYEIEGLP